MPDCTVLYVGAGGGFVKTPIALASSILVIAASSALLKIVEYFNGLSSPSVPSIKGIVQVD
ncbi:MAG TPA: hypothetical protein VGH51_13000 [Candidatus Angelobacter sp.]